MLHIKLKGMEQRAPCKLMFCPYTHTRSLGWGLKVKTFFFSESSHVAYQINGNGAYSTMQAHIFLGPWSGVKGSNFFLIVVMLRIKLNGIERREPYTHIFGPYTQPRPVRSAQKVKLFSECGHVAYQIKGKVYTNIAAKTLTLHTPLYLWVGLKDQILKLCR